MIYQYDVTEIRLDTGIDLTGATLLQIRVQKPSDIHVVWPATRYLQTSYITYTTSSSDLDEIGQYILQPYVEINDEPTVIDDLSVIDVVPSSDIPELVDTFKIYYRFLDVQTYEEQVANTHTDADILYTDFQTYLELAQDELQSLLIAKNITLTDVQKKVAMCHLIADYFEMGNPDWSFRSQSQAPGVSFSRGEETGPRAALNKLLDSIAKANVVSSMSAGRGAKVPVTRIKDAVNYPKRWKRTDIPAYNPFDGGFDEDEVDDMGYNDAANSEWS